MLELETQTEDLDWKSNISLLLWPHSTNEASLAGVLEAR
jgi:hypothetical protein